MLIAIQSKEDALISLGRILPAYAELQAHYSSQIHMPDYRAFSGEWEQSLYRPIRDAARSATDKPGALDSGALLYCAPGPHAPFLREESEPRLASKFSAITLLDIDSAALQSAKKYVQAINETAMVEEIDLDFTGPFGQRLCDLYSEALRREDTTAGIVRRLSNAAHLSASIFFDDDQVLARLCTQLDAASGGRRFTHSVSEMVASFTGTAVWLAFRSALYQRFAGLAAPQELELCLHAATLLWQKYNECFLAFHLKFLRRHMVPGGSILLVFDIRKVYDDPERDVLGAFLPDASLTETLENQGFRIAKHATLCWRDHPCGFDVSICGIPVSDFQPHTHDVELYIMEVAS